MSDDHWRALGRNLGLNYKLTKPSWLAQIQVRPRPRESTRSSEQPPLFSSWYAAYVGQNLRGNAHADSPTCAAV
jgi:hypothetical protein